MVALQFDGSGDYVTVPDNSALRFNQSSNFTIACWVKPSSSGYLICKMRASGIGIFGYQLSWESSSSRFKFIAESSGYASTSIYSSNNSAPAGAWRHVAAVYSNKTMKIYCNGQPQGNGTFAYNTGTTTPDKALAIGARSYDLTVTSFFTGIIDDVRIYNSALSDQDVLTLYQGQSDAGAYNPNPANNASNMSLNTLLSWRPGLNAISHDVYLGTNFSEINAAVVPLATVDVNNFNPGNLLFDTIYYWRIDEFDGTDTHKGIVWNFSTVSAKAVNPLPSNNAVSVNPLAILTWTPGPTAISHDVYIGTNSSSGKYRCYPNATVTENNYVPNDLNVATTYYWRIDESDGLTKFKGNLWNFTTRCSCISRS